MSEVLRRGRVVDVVRCAIRSVGDLPSNEDRRDEVKSALLGTTRRLRPFDVAVCPGSGRVSGDRPHLAGGDHALIGFA